MSKGSKRRPTDAKKYAESYDRIIRNPVKKNMDKLHKPSTHRDKTKYDRKVKWSYDGNGVPIDE